MVCLFSGDALRNLELNMQSIHAFTAHKSFGFCCARLLSRDTHFWCTQSNSVLIVETRMRTKDLPGIRKGSRRIVFWMSEKLVPSTQHIVAVECAQTYGCEDATNLCLRLPRWVENAENVILYYFKTAFKFQLIYTFCFKFHIEMRSIFFWVYVSFQFMCCPFLARRTDCWWKFNNPKANTDMRCGRFGLVFSSIPYVVDTQTKNHYIRL